MAGLPVEIRGTLYDLQSKSSRQVYLVGEATRSDVGIGGGPIYPPDKPPGGNGDHIWGPTDPRPTPPIWIPPAVPPSLQPPNPPNPGDPVTPVPPPEGSPGWPVQPIQPPPYIVVSYPGLGPVVVPQPLTAQPK